MENNRKFIRNCHILFFSMALTYIAFLWSRPYPLDFMVKSIPIFCLAILTFVLVPGPRGKLMTSGFLFSGAGDVILAINQGQYFVYGLSAFLVAHIFYIIAFLSGGMIKMTLVRKAAAAAMVVYGSTLGVVMLPGLGEMTFPVLIYLAVILVMGVSACAAGTNHGLIIAGAALFIVSDSLIAINKFLTPIPAASLFIMTTYYAGQFLICRGVIKKADPDL